MTAFDAVTVGVSYAVPDYRRADRQPYRRQPTTEPALRPVLVVDKAEVDGRRMVLVEAQQRVSGPPSHWPATFDGALLDVVRAMGANATDRSLHVGDRVWMDAGRLRGEWADVAAEQERGRVVAERKARLDARFRSEGLSGEDVTDDLGFAERISRTRLAALLDERERLAAKVIEQEEALLMRDAETTRSVA